MKNLQLLAPDVVGAAGRGRLHRGQAQDFEQVVLDDVAQHPGLLVERPARPHAHGLGGGDLDVVHVLPRPQRLEDAVREPEHQDVLDRLLAQVVVDAEGL